MFADAKIAMFEASRPDIEALPPSHRRKLAELCRHWADLADPGSPATETSPLRQVPMVGVLLELSRGLRREVRAKSPMRGKTPVAYPLEERLMQGTAEAYDALVEELEQRQGQGPQSTQPMRQI